MRFLRIVRNLWSRYPYVRYAAANTLAGVYPVMGRPFLWLRRRDQEVARGVARVAQRRGT